MPNFSRSLPLFFSKTCGKTWVPHRRVGEGLHNQNPEASWGVDSWNVKTLSGDRATAKQNWTTTGRQSWDEVRQDMSQLNSTAGFLSTFVGSCFLHKSCNRYRCTLVFVMYQKSLVAKKGSKPSSLSRIQPHRSLFTHFCLNKNSCPSPQKKLKRNSRDTSKKYGDVTLLYSSKKPIPWDKKSSTWMSQEVTKWLVSWL